MANNNESMSIENEPQANPMPIISNKVSLEDLFQLMKIQNGELNNKLNQFDDKFDDIKKEIKKQSCHYDKRLSEIKTRLNEKIELENKKLELDKLELNKEDKVSSSGNDDKINKNIVIGDNSVDVGSDNEILWGIEYDNNGMIVCFEGLKRVCREGIIVGELQGLDFSLNGVFGGDIHVFRKDESAFDVYLGDKRSENSCPWIFCASDRWCENKVVVSPAYIERENVIWGYDRRYCVRELCDNWEMELYRVNRYYEEFIERLGGERSENNNKYLPCNETEVVGDDVDNNDNITYLIMTDYTGGDRTMTNHDRLNEFEDNDEHLNCICIYDVGIRYLIINNVYSFKIRLLFDDGG